MVFIWLFDLMLGELDEDSFQRGSTNWEIVNLSALEFQVAQKLENSTKTSRDLIHLLFDLEIWFKHNCVNAVNSNHLVNCRVMDHRRESLLDDLLNLLFFTLMGDCDLVTLSVFLLQNAWTSVASELSVDHDGKIVTKGLCFVHSMSCQDQRRISQFLEHLE